MLKYEILSSGTIEVTLPNEYKVIVFGNYIPSAENPNTYELKMLFFRVAFLIKRFNFLEYRRFHSASTIRWIFSLNERSSALGSASTSSRASAIPENRILLSLLQIS